MALPLDREPRTKAEALEAIEKLELEAAHYDRVQREQQGHLNERATSRRAMLRVEVERIRKAMAHLPD